MSLPAYRWAIKQTVRNAAERAVLSVLADFADDRGVCFPSVGTIAALCGMSRRGVGYTLQRLVEHKLLAITGNTSRRFFHLAMAPLATPIVPCETRAGAAQGGAGTCANPAGACAEAARDLRNPCALTSQEPVNEPLGADAPDQDMPSGKTKGTAKGTTIPATTARHGTRLPPDWQPPQDQIARIERELPQVDWRAETEKFRDYWIAQPGQRGVKLDWPATWRNWMRNAQRFAPRGFGASGNGTASRGYGGNAAPGTTSDDPWAMRLRAFRERGIWLGEWGPKPGEKGCRATQDTDATQPNLV